MYQTIIHEILPDKIDIDEAKFFLANLNSSGNIFIFTNNIYDEAHNIINSFFEIIEKYTECGHSYVNTIVVPCPKRITGEGIKNNVFYIIWFVKNKQKMQFDKNPIREKHIWKNVEWGKRKKNYHPLGKDPGNIWIPTEDDGNGKITEHISLNLKEIIKRIVSSTLKDNEKPLITFNDTNFLLNQVIKYKKTKTESPSNEKVYSNVIYGSSEKMQQLKSNSVQLMITSPPYWDLKNYFKNGQIGQESYSKYLERMGAVWQETYRVLSNEGSMWININSRNKDGKPVLIPLDIIKQCSKLGFFLKEIFIWHKSNGIPTGKNNIVDRHEYVLWFTKSSNYCLNSINFKDYRNNKINNGIIWNINRKAGSVGKNFVHPAIYPTKLVDRIINLASNPGEAVLDPFLGSGTTSICAANLKRNSIGYEYNEGFHPLIKHRFDNEITNNKVEVSFDNKPDRKSNDFLYRT